MRYNHSGFQRQAERIARLRSAERDNIAARRLREQNQRRAAAGGPVLA